MPSIKTLPEEGEKHVRYQKRREELIRKGVSPSAATDMAYKEVYLC